MNLPRPRPMQVVATVAVAAIAALPLWAIAVYQWPLAQGDTWIFIQHYQNYTEGRAGWNSLLSAHGPHPGMLLRPVVLLPLTVGKGDFSVLTWLSWLVAFASFTFIALLLRRQWRRLEDFGQARATGDANAGHRSGGPLLLVVIAAALVFSMGQGLAWTWEFVWINWLPGACLAALLWFDQVTADRGLPGAGARPLRDWLVRGGLAWLALVAFGNGMFVWPVLALGWMARRACGDRSAPGWRAQLLWWPLFALLTWLLVLRPAGDGGDGALGHLLGRPLMTVHYVLCLTGGSLANGTDIDPAWQGAVVGAVVVVILLGGLMYGWRHRRDPALLMALLPWFQAAAYAGLACLLIAMGRMHQTVYTAFASRYLTLTFWLPLAAAAVLGFCLRHWLAGRERKAATAGHGHADAPARWRIRCTLAGGLLAGIAAGLWACQGMWGLHDMRWYHRQKLTVAAAYQFIDILPDEIDRSLSRVSVGRQEVVRFLRDRDQLPGIDPLPSPDPAALRLRAGINDTEWSAAVVAKEDGGDQLEVRGFARMNSRREPPDLLVVTVAPAPGEMEIEVQDDEAWPGERIAALIAVERPRDFDRRQYHANVHREHYLGFGDRIPLEVLERALENGHDEPIVVRLYGIDTRRQVGRRLAGSEVIDPGGVIRQ